MPYRTDQRRQSSQRDCLKRYCMFRITTSSAWNVASVVACREAGRHLSAIGWHVAADHVVVVGGSRRTACSAFVSEPEFNRQRISFPVASRDIDIEVLRQTWSDERAQTEDTGEPLRIFQHGKILFVLVPTARALKLRKAPNG